MKKLLVLLFILVLTINCNESENLPKDVVYKEITVKTPVELNAHSHGGIVSETGEDLNQNGELESNEITSTITTYNSQDGVNFILSDDDTLPVPLVMVRPAYNLKCGDGTVNGAHPGFGGKIIEVGFDLDGDEYLSNYDWPIKVSGEVQIWQNICLLAADGLVLTVVEYFEPTDDCPNGGYTVTIGADSDGDKFLSPEEVDYQENLCII